MAEQSGEMPLEEPIDPETGGLVADVLTATSRSEREDRIIKLLDAKVSNQNEYEMQLEGRGRPNEEVMRKRDYLNTQYARIKELYPWL